MQVAPDYVRTEVGVFPADWPVLPLRRISPKQGVGLVINPSTYFDKAGTVPLLVGSNVSEGVIDASSANRITEASNSALSASRLTSGDLVTVRVGEPGVTAVVPPELDGCNCASMMIVRKHPSFNSHWLCAVMNSRLGRSQVEHVQYGTAQKQFNISDAVNFKFATPPRQEQDAIAVVLGDIDALLAGLDRLIAKKRDLKQAAMQQLLTGQTRLPGFQGEWEIRRLGELADMGSGGTPLSSVPAFYGGGIPWVSIADMTSSGRLIATTDKTLTSLGVERSAAQLLPVGTVLYAMYASLGECCIAGVPVTTSQAILGIRPKQRLTGDFLYYFLISMKEKVRTLGQQGTQANLNKGIVQDFRIALPSREEQMAIAAVLSDMDAELAALEARRDKTRALKQGMMQELLTGRTRLV
jgi:type I restriction enzyme S subunit